MSSKCSLFFPIIGQTLKVDLSILFSSIVFKNPVFLLPDNGINESWTVTVISDLVLDTHDLVDIRNDFKRLTDYKQNRDEDLK